MTLRPNRNIHKALISTPSRLVGEFEGDGVLLTHAWPQFGDRSLSQRLSEGPASRSAFVFAFQTEEAEPPPNYSPMGDWICAYLAVLFGKRFDHHGLVEENGCFHIPDLFEFGQLCQHNLPHNSHRPRTDFTVPLDLTEVQRIKPLLGDKSIDRNFLRTFQTCSKFYLQALQSAERDSEVAYLHLITSIEILSNFYKYDKEEELLDEDSKSALQRIKHECVDGAKLARFISGKMFQVKKRFLKTLSVLIDETFFSRSEASEPLFGFKRDTFIKCMASAYDLRSRYVHTGTPFGRWVSLVVGGDHNEVQVGTPVVKEDRKLGKLIGDAPTLIGLERVTRYALLRYAETHRVYLAPSIIQSEDTDG